LNRRLEEARWLASDEYSMADIITFPWIRTATQSGARFAERGSIDLDDYPAVKRWHAEMAARPAVQRGLAVLADQQRDLQISDTERENMFGRTQFTVR
ncbi:MAG: glutathione S-transferase family protein, partial [Alphaproteobacteria bacterium]|nr:glutathione S-transferase family protein [Alphaproteobacteria bacterium]